MTHASIAGSGPPSVARTTTSSTAPSLDSSNSRFRVRGGASGEPQALRSKPLVTAATCRPNA